NAKVVDGNTSAAAVPTVAGLKGSDTVTGLAETYDNPNVGTGKTLSVTSYTVNDGNGGLNYTVTLVANNTGVITWIFALTGPLKSPAQLGSAVPVAWTLQNGSGAYITDLTTLVKLESVFNGAAPLTGCVASLVGTYQTLYSPPNGSTGNSSFRVVSPGFQFNWDTTTATATGTGCYTVKITLNDGTSKMTNGVQLK